MSLDRSLKTGSGLSRHRNVLSRAERIGRLTEKGKFDMAIGSPLNLPKVGNRKVAVAKAVKKEVATEGAPGAAAPAPAAGAKGGAPGAKAAAPAKGAAPAKAAAPAAKGGAKK
jgi:small basic protein (TIGR04137 family)